MVSYSWQLQSCPSGAVPTNAGGCSLPVPWVDRVRANFFIWNLVLPGMLEGRKGGCTMTFEQVVLLLTLLGGAIYVTFEITWTVSHSDDKKKK